MKHGRERHIPYDLNSRESEKKKVRNSEMAYESDCQGLEIGGNRNGFVKGYAF